MNPRTTGVLLLIALALGAFVRFYVIGGEEGRREAEERSKRLFAGVEAGDVVWLALTTRDGVDVRAERAADGWRIVEPVEFPGDAFALDGVASAAAEATSEATYEEPQPFEVYGLEEGASELRFGAGAEERGLRIGDQAPMGGATYARVVGEDAVHTIASHQANALDKDFDDLREKRILDFDPAGVRRIVASWPDGRVELLREDGDGVGWRLVSPLEGPADAEAVRDLLSDLSFLNAQGFEDAPGDDAERGLDRPAFAVELEVAAEPGEAGAEEDGEPERRRLAMAIGSRVEGEHRFVRGAWPSLYRIRSDDLEDFAREVVHYRFKELSSFPSADAKRVELRFHEPGAGETVVVAERGEAGWSSAPEAMEPEKIARLVEELSTLAGVDILAERVGADERASLELDPANVTFLVSGEGEGAEARLAEVRLGRIRSGGGVVAQAGENPQVFELPIEVGEHLPLNRLGFRNHFLAPEPEPEPPPISQEPSRPPS